MGYFTTDPERVTLLWEEIRQRIKSDLTPFNSLDDNIEALNKQLKYNNVNIEKIFQDESEQKIQSLLDKFNH